MIFDFRIDKDTCFYYWVQAVSGWDVYPPESTSYSYYREKLTLTPYQQKNLSEIADLIAKHVKPRLLLVELYSGLLESESAMKIAGLSTALYSEFEPIWQETEPWLIAWREQLTEADLDSFDSDFRSICIFLKSKPHRNATTVYLLQNPPNAQPAGHAIKAAGFILVHPSGGTGDVALKATVATLVHEYIHTIEYGSLISRKTFEQSYNEIVKPTQATCPAGYEWPALYAETVVRIFANRITGGYFREKIYGKPAPTVQGMEDGFNKLYEQGRATVEQVASWVALHVLDDTIRYLKLNKQLDRKLVDNISQLFTKYY